MVTATREAIYLGNFSDADTDESNSTIEDLSVYEQTFGSFTDPLADHQIDITYDDFNDDGAIKLNHTVDPPFPGVGEDFSYSLDGGATTITTQGDSLVVADAFVTYTDGSTASYSYVVLFQDVEGNLWLTNSDFAGTDLNGDPPKHIESITISNADDGQGFFGPGDGFDGLLYDPLQDFICFMRGTNILTEYGNVRVENLKVGDLVKTSCGDSQPIRWIGRKKLSRISLEKKEKLRPVRIKSDALGPGLPEKDLLVSRQHRMVVSSKICKRMFGESRALISAVHLTSMPGIYVDNDVQEVEYFHLLFDKHEIIFAEGAESESLFTGPEALKSIPTEAIEEIYEIFPELEFKENAHPAAAIIPPGRLQKKLIARHIKNEKNLVNSVAE